MVAIPADTLGLTPKSYTGDLLIFAGYELINKSNKSNTDQ